MKQLVFSALALAAGILSGAQGSSGAPLPKLTPPPIVTSFAEERPSVVQTGEFSDMPMPETVRKLKAPAGSAAAALPGKQRNFFWRPSKLTSSAIGAADLTGAALSADGTLAVISERIGGEGKPNSTRVLLFNIPERRLAGGFVIPEVLLSAPRFVKDSPLEILAVRHESKPFKVANGLVRINLLSRRIVDQADTGASRVTSFTQCGEKVVWTLHDSSQLHVCDLNDLAAAPAEIRSALASPRVCSAGGTLFAFGPEGIEKFDRQGKAFIPPVEIVKAPSGFAPRSGVVIDAEVPSICFTGASNQPLWYFRETGFRKLCDRTSDVAAYDAGARLLYVGLPANSRIAKFQMPQGEELGKPVSPNNLKPVNRNGNFALLTVPAYKGELLLIDDRGNVYLLDVRKARWKKNAICIADKAGFR